MQSSDLYPKTIPRDLYHRSKCAPAQADSRQRPRTAFISNYAGFGRFSIFHYDHERNQTSVRKVCEFQLSTRLVKDQVVGQADVFEMRTKRAVVAIGDR